jgi:hypothetical protein
MKKKERVEILLEDMQSKFDLVLEGNDAPRADIQRLREETNARFESVDDKLGLLNRKIDGVETKLSARIDGVESSLATKIDGVAADLKAYRADTEAHRTTYRVSEST